MAAAADVLGGRLPLDVLRGRSCLPMAVQAAEIALFRHLGETAMAAVRVLGHRRDGELTTVDLAAAADRWTVSVRTTLGRRRAAHLPGAPTEPAAAPRGGRRRAGRRPLTCS